MATFLTNSQIEEHCNHIVLLSSRYYGDLLAFFQTIYYTGCRWIELYELSRWTYDGLRGYTVQCAKGSTTRYIDEANVAEFIKTKIANGDQINPNSRYNSMSIYAERFALFPHLRCKDKEISLHIFRHNLVKKLYDLGYTPEMIGVIIGEIDVKNVNIYVNSQIYYNP
jgi:hypothetical protein